ncbi:hypothetical protein H072_11012 [Dactylellina haptotyla CBS 200.50]|uniref:Uncharacterized protein n=1 Tax=Dactylellina haptotyla (strain CBS 200.50) TaxID=1284197 RepID=S7ZYQ2_DACHA|nr:hypothetical protein H072_11012 [Dactylellina haptotyla CBS 200.50]
MLREDGTIGMSATEDNDVWRKFRSLVLQGVLKGCEKWIGRLPGGKIITTLIKVPAIIEDMKHIGDDDESGFEQAQEYYKDGRKLYKDGKKIIKGVKAFRKVFGRSGGIVENAPNPYYYDAMYAYDGGRIQEDYSDDYDQVVTPVLKSQGALD